jgi:PIN domain nuclease of toxin-antitoxin system
MGRSRVSRPLDSTAALKPRVWVPADLPDYAGPLLLDTHIWLWHLGGSRAHTTSDLLPLLDRSGARSNLFVSDISYWEVAVEAARGRLTLSVDVAIWLQQAEQAPGIRFRTLHRPVLLLSTRLPGSVHNDPADRMLIASAQLANLPLVTADRLVIEYAQEHPGAPVVDARP